MTVNANPYIVTSGLVLNLDAGNPRSYPETGTIWNGLTTEGYIGTLNNGVGYSTNKGGALTFDGVDDRVTLNSNTIISGTQDFTIESAFNTSDAGGVEYIFGNYGLGNNGLELYIYQNRVTLYYAGVYFFSTNSAISSNIWYWITAIRSGNSNLIYINGTLNASGTNSTSIPTSNPYTIGNGYDFNSEIFVGSIAVVRCYNIALTADQVAQNFAAMRGRYGI